jgi:hypothetical protein
LYTIKQDVPSVLDTASLSSIKALLSAATAQDLTEISAEKVFADSYTTSVQHVVLTNKSLRTQTITEDLPIFDTIKILENQE